MPKECRECGTSTTCTECRGRGYYSGFFVAGRNCSHCKGTGKCPDNE